MAPFVLKFKGNKTFSPLSQINDAETLIRTWNVCTKVATHLEQGPRLQNLSWRLWFIQVALVEVDNAKQKREFKKFSKGVSDKLDKDKRRSIIELEAPNFKRTDSGDKLRLRVEEIAHQRDLGPDRTNSPSGINNRSGRFANNPDDGGHHTSTLQTPLLPGYYSSALVYPPSSSTFVNAHGLPNAFAGSSGLFIPTSNNEFRSSSTARCGALYISTGSMNMNQGNSNSLLHFNGGNSYRTGQGQQPTRPNINRFPIAFSSDFGSTSYLPSLQPNPNFNGGSGLSSIDVDMQSVNTGFGFGVPRPVFEFPIEETKRGEVIDGTCATTNRSVTDPYFFMPDRYSHRIIEHSTFDERSRPRGVQRPHRSSIRHQPDVNDQAELIRTSLVRMDSQERKRKRRRLENASPDQEGSGSGSGELSYAESRSSSRASGWSDHTPQHGTNTMLPSPSDSVATATRARFLEFSASLDFSAPRLASLSGPFMPSTR